MAIRKMSPRNLAGLTIPTHRIVSLNSPVPRKTQMRSTLLIFAVLALTVYGQLIIKARALTHAAETAVLPSKLHYLLAMLTDYSVLSGFAAAFLAGICWMLAIERLDLVFAYPFMALSFVLVPLGSTIFFGEMVPPIQWLGLGLIVAGVTVSALAR
jgi:multidrug transporter EmrE-like cation transporter